MELKVIEIVYCNAAGDHIDLAVCRTCPLHRFNGKGKVYCGYSKGAAGRDSMPELSRAN